jgi:lysine 6-dehydrogenase
MNNTTSKKYVVLGAGMMGSAVAFDLAQNEPASEIVLADIDPTVATRSANAIGRNVRPLSLDVDDAAAVQAALPGATVVVSAVSYRVNLQLSRAAIRSGVHMVDMGGNNDVVRQQLALDSAARASNVTIVPNGGLAPGLINILAMTGFGEFDTVEAIRLRVGGLPAHPRPPLNYQIVFSAEGLLNEYLEKAIVLRNGMVTEVDSMSDLEEITFPAPLGTLEAFTTSGGVSFLPELLKGKVNMLDYKTIRYRGHCEKFKTLLDLGFATNEPLMVGKTVRTNREFFTDLLRKKLDFGEPDLVVARATITGFRKGVPTTITYELVDRYDERTRISAMMRTTAFPVSIIARMLAHGVITDRGVRLPEQCVPGKLMIDELSTRAIIITSSTTETSR